MAPRVVQVVGVDRVIAVELQRPGVDTESTFFEVPVQNCMTERLGIEHYAKHPQLLKGGKVGPSLRHQPSSRIEKSCKLVVPHLSPTNACQTFGLSSCLMDIPLLTTSR